MGHGCLLPAAGGDPGRWVVVVLGVVEKLAPAGAVAEIWIGTESVPAQRP
jgi:hypothetical protein